MAQDNCQDCGIVINTNHGYNARCPVCYQAKMQRDREEWDQKWEQAAIMRQNQPYTPPSAANMVVYNWFKYLLPLFIVSVIFKISTYPVLHTLSHYGFKIFFIPLFLITLAVLVVVAWMTGDWTWVTDFIKFYWTSRDCFRCNK